MRRVAEIDVHGGQRDTERGGQHQQRDEGRNHQPQEAPARLVPEDQQRDEQHDQLQEEVDDGGTDRCERQDLAWKPDLAHEARIADDGDGGTTETGGKEVPREETGEQEDGEVRNLDLQDDLENNVEDHEVQRRVEQRPEEHEGAVLVLDLQLLAGEVHQELAVGPHDAEPLERARSGRDIQML